MSKTADNLVYEVASILNRYVVGEALGDIEYQTIESNIEPVLSEVADIICIDRDDIPDRYFQTIARLVAIHSTAKFSGTPADLEEIRLHERRLRVLVGSVPAYSTLKAEYF